jgi:hypothetical protein
MKLGAPDIAIALLEAYKRGLISYYADGPRR